MKQDAMTSFETERKTAEAAVTARAVEGRHWSPPEAPMAMPRQVLEAEEREPFLRSLLSALLGGTGGRTTAAN